MFIKRTLALVTILALFTSVGCSRWTNVEKWMSGGALVGAAVGGIWANEGGILSVAEGALVGAASGATVGALVGDIADHIQDNKWLAEIDRLTEENKAQALLIENLKGQITAKDKEIADLRAELERLRGVQPTVTAAPTPEFTITFNEVATFKPGKAVLTAEGRARLDEFAQTLLGHAGKFIMIEGHTDDQPIKYSGWKSNWELGSARALTILHYLADKGIDPSTMSAATFSQYQNEADNATVEGRSTNRRVVVAVYEKFPRFSRFK